MDSPIAYLSKKYLFLQRCSSFLGVSQQIHKIQTPSPQSKVYVCA